jgi:hypothetical protein
MHIHITQHEFLYIWFGCSFINWFFLMGEYNYKFRKTLEDEEGAFWSIIASLFAGINGLLVTLVAHRGKHFAFRPITRKEKEQLLMLKMLEDDSSQNQSGDMAMGNTKNGGYTPRRARGVRIAI